GHRLLRLGAQPPHPLIAVVARERREVHAGDRPQEPRDLPVLLHGTTGKERLCTALDGTGVDAYAVDPVQVERDAGVDPQRSPLQLHDGLALAGWRDERQLRHLLAQLKPLWCGWGHEGGRSEEHTSELQSLRHLVCRLLLEKKKTSKYHY